MSESDAGYVSDGGEASANPGDGDASAKPGDTDSGAQGDRDSGDGESAGVPKGVLVYHRYSTYETGDSEMFLVDLPSGERSEELGSVYGLCNLMNGILSPDGESLVAMGQARDGAACGPTLRSEFEIYMLDLVHKGVATRVTNNAVPDEDPQFSPSGDAVFFKHDGHLARWAVGADTFTSCEALPPGNFCFAADGEQSKPVVSADGKRLCYWDGGGADADVYCVDLALALAGQSLQELRIPVAANAGMEDYFPVTAGPYIYYARWRARDNKANVIERKILADLTQEAELAGFCSDAERDYSDPCDMTQGWLAFSTTEAGSGGYDLFVSRFDGSGKQSLDALVPGLNSEKNELGAYFLPR